MRNRTNRFAQKPQRKKARRPRRRAGPGGQSADAPGQTVSSGLQIDRHVHGPLSNCAAAATCVNTPSRANDRGLRQAPVTTCNPPPPPLPSLSSGLRRVRMLRAAVIPSIAPISAVGTDLPWRQAMVYISLVPDRLAFIEPLSPSSSVRPPKGPRAEMGWFPISMHQRRRRRPDLFAPRRRVH